MTKIENKSLEKLAFLSRKFEVKVIEPIQNSQQSAKLSKKKTSVFLDNQEGQAPLRSKKKIRKKNINFRILFVTLMTPGSAERLPASPV